VLNPHRLTIRENGKIVLLVEWSADGEQLQSRYKPGDWGRVMRRCLARRAETLHLTAAP
jgi:hypothetical protein